MKTEISPEIIAEAQSLLALAMTTKSDVADVFVDFSPHVAQIAVRIYQYGWREHVDDILNKAVYLDDETSLTRVRALVEEVKATITAVPTEPKAATSSKSAALREAAAKLLAKADAIMATP